MIVDWFESRIGTISWTPVGRILPCSCAC